MIQVFEVTIEKYNEEVVCVAYNSNLKRAVSIHSRKNVHPSFSLEEEAEKLNFILEGEKHEVYLNECENKIFERALNIIESSYQVQIFSIFPIGSVEYGSAGIEIVDFNARFIISARTKD
jgi:hypothetical protein